MELAPGATCSSRERHSRTTRAAKQILTRAIAGCGQSGNCFPLSAAAVQLADRPREVNAVAARQTVDRYRYHWAVQHAAEAAHPPPDNSCGRCSELIEQICRWLADGVRSCAAARGLLGGNDWLAAAARRTDCLRHNNGGVYCGLPLAARLHLERHLLCKWFADRQLWSARGGGAEPWHKLEPEEQVYNCNRQQPTLEERTDLENWWSLPFAQYDHNRLRDRSIRFLIERDIQVVTTDGGRAHIALVQKIGVVTPASQYWSPRPGFSQSASGSHLCSTRTVATQGDTQLCCPSKNRKHIRGGAKNRAKRERRLARLEAATGGPHMLEESAGRGVTAD